MLERFGNRRVRRAIRSWRTLPDQIVLTILASGDIVFLFGGLVSAAYVLLYVAVSPTAVAIPQSS